VQIQCLTHNTLSGVRRHSHLQTESHIDVILNGGLNSVGAFLFTTVITSSVDTEPHTHAHTHTHTNALTHLQSGRGVPRLWQSSDT